jgi:hypothetical protein
MMDSKEISKRLTSEDSGTLKQSISFVNDRISLIRDRAKVAETRATAMLAVSGILAGFVVHFGAKLESDKTPENVLFAVLYLASILLLIKAIYYAIKALWVLRGYELNPELAFDLQGKSGHNALREELTWKIWEYYQILPLTNEKLFWLNRSQRNTVSAITTFMFLGSILFVQINFGLELPWFFTVLITLVLVFLVLFLDPILEHFGGVWQKGKDQVVQQAGEADR